MLKFFRRIRQKLVTENRFSKYLLYALGEIILVVLGILIALQVNEWNKERNRKIAEEKIIAQLKTDLLNSESELEEIRAFFLRRTRASAFVLRAFWQTEIPEDFLSYYRVPWANRVYSPVLSTARSLINSGNVELLSSAEFKNDLVSYVEFVDYKLKDISRYEETYYRKAVEKVSEEWIGNTFSKEQINQYIAEQAKTASFKYDYELNTARLPTQIEKVPFKADLNAFLQDKSIYDSYNSLHLSHRNIYRSYGEILKRTYSLLNLLDKVTGTSSITIGQINQEDLNLAFDSLDLKILQQADALLPDRSKWNKEDDKVCNDDFTNEHYSIFCALFKASLEIAGEYSPRRPAVEIVKLIIHKYNQRRVIRQEIIDWNNHPETTFEEIKKVFQEAMEEVKKQL